MRPEEGGSSVSLFAVNVTRVVLYICAYYCQHPMPGVALESSSRFLVEAKSDGTALTTRIKSSYVLSPA